MNKIILKLLLGSILLFSSCDKKSTSWTDPNPTGNPAPEIFNLLPDSSFAGSVIDIYGSGFSEDPTANMVLFDFSPAEIITASEDHMEVRLPMINDKSLPVKIAVQGSELWGHWQEEIDTTITIIDTLIIGIDTSYVESQVDTTYVNDLDLRMLG